MPRLRASVLAASALATTASLHAQQIVLDGAFDDWQSIVPVVSDDPNDAPGHEIDLGAIRCVSDAGALHLHIELGTTVNLPQLDSKLWLILDADDDDRTGRTVHDVVGADIVLRFPAPRGGAELHLPAVDETTSPYDLGIAMAPSYAASQIELRIERGGGSRRLQGALTGSSVSGRLMALTSDGAIADATAAFTHLMPSYEPAAIAITSQVRASPFQKFPGALRVVTWNGEHGAMLKEPAAAGRILQALDPDVVMLQELKPDTSLQALREFAENHISRDGWNVILGSGGGNLRCAILSRRQLANHPDLEPMPYPGERSRTMRTAGVAMEYDDAAILLVSTHMKCCGKIGDSSDQKRMREAQGVQTALRTAIERGNAQGVIVAGDFNLVGSRDPLDTMIDGSDVDGSSLAVAEALQLNGRSNATWRKSSQRFLPGRLDFLLYSDASLTLRRTTTE